MNSCRFCKKKYGFTQPYIFQDWNYSEREQFYLHLLEGCAGSGKGKITPARFWVAEHLAKPGEIAPPFDLVNNAFGDLPEDNPLVQLSVSEWKHPDGTRQAETKKAFASDGVGLDRIDEEETEDDESDDEIDEVDG